MRWIARVFVLTSVAAVAAGAGFALAGDDSQSAAAHRNPAKGPFGFSKVVFLSHVNTVGMPIFPGDPDFELETLFTVENDGFKLNKMTIGEHSGTHWGAPCHFNAGERCAEDMAAEDFFHPAAIVDARKQSAKDPDYALTVADLKRFERKHGRIPAERDRRHVDGVAGALGRSGGLSSTRARTASSTSRASRSRRRSG